MAREFQRKLVVTADTSGLAKGAAEVQRFGQGVNSASDYLKQMKTTMDAATFREFAVAMQPAIAAEKEMSRWTKQLAADMKPLAAEMRAQEVLQAKATASLQKRTLSEVRAAEALKKTYDEPYRNALRYAGVEEQVQRQIQQRNLSIEEGNTILAGAATRFKQMGAATGAANQNIKLTSGQMQGLGYQINDVGTMLALGASPFQVIASQAGQVIQVLGDGPKGVKGSLAAIGSSIAALATRTNLIVGGLTAAGAAAIYFATRSDESVKTAEDALKGYKALVDSLDDSYSLAGDAAERYFKRAQMEGPNVALAAIEGSQATLTASLQREMEGLFDKTQNIANRSIKTFADLTPEVLKGQDAIRRLGQELNSGAITVGQFRDGIAQLRTDPTTAPAVKKIADSLLDGSVNAFSLASALGAVGEAAATASGKMGRLKVPSVQDMVAPFGGAMDMMKRLQPEAFDGLVDGLRDQADALTETTTKTHTYADAVADQRQEIADSLASLRLQTDMLGESDGAIAAAKMRMDALAEAQRAATDAGKGAIDPALVDFINRQAEEYGTLTDTLKANTEAQREQEKAANDVRRQQERVAEFASDLQFERSIFGLSETEQRVLEAIRGLDVDFDSYEGQRLAAGIRYNDSLVETQDHIKEMGEVGKDAFLDIVDALGSGENAVDSLMGAFASLGKQMASIGAQKLFDGLFGGKAGQTASGIAGIGSAIGKAANQNTPAYSAGSLGQTNAAPVGAVERRILPALGKATDSMSAAANAIRTIESGSAAGNYRALGPVTGNGDRAYGAYQVMGNNIPQWSKAALGRVVGNMEFLSSPDLQDAVFEHRFGGYMGKYGPEGASRAWFAGEGGMKNYKATDVVGTSVSGYGSRFGQLYSQNVASSTNDTRGLAKGVSAGVVDAQRKLTSYDLGGYDAGSPGGGGGFLGAQISKPGTFLGMQHGGLTVGGGLGVAAGAFGGGYESGNAISGALSGAMAGLSTGNPAAAVVGAIGGAIGSPLSRKGSKRA